VQEITRALKKPAPVLAAITATVWLITWHAAEYLLTEQFFIINRLNSRQASLWLIALMALVIAAVLLKKIQFQPKITACLTIYALLILTVAATGLYQKYYSSLQKIPKIKNVSKNWSIQGDKIKIIGKNFGPAWQPGEVWVDDLEFLIYSWTDNKVIAEQPLNQDYKVDTLRLINHYGNQAVVEPFELKDPADVL
jgi:hypothetical protein